MNWDRAKTVLIFLFLCINIFLLLVLLYTTQNTRVIPKDVIQTAITVLEQRGIAVSENVIPEKRFENASVDMKNIFSDPDVTAGRLLGENYSCEETDSETRYNLDKKQMMPEEGSIQYRNEKNVQPVDEKNKKDILERVLTELEAMGISAESHFVLGESVTDGIYTVKLGPVYNRIPVRGIVLEVHSDAEAIIEMSGNWFEPKRKEVDKQEALLDVTSVLVNLIYIQDTDNIRITEIGYQYWVAEEYLGNKSVSAVPVYVFGADNGKQYMFDARTGKYINTEF